MRTSFINKQANVVGNEGRPTDITFTAPLILHGDPVEGKDAATKSYVDYVFTHLSASNIKSGSLPVSRLPSFAGDVSNVAGSNIFTLNPTGVPSGTYKKVTVDAKGRVVGYGDLLASDIPPISWTKIYKNKPSTLVGYGINDGINIAGDTLTGYLRCTATPTQDMHAVTRGYVEQAAAEAGSVIEPGYIIPYASSTTPEGYLRCNGGEVSKVVYPALYEALGSPIVSNTVVGNGAPYKLQYDFNMTQGGDIVVAGTGTSLPGAQTAGVCFVTKNRVYYCGGASAINTVVSTVRTAPINADGTLGAWAAGTAMPGVLVTPRAIMTKNRVYVIGGGTNAATASVGVYSAPINADGTLGAWTSGPNYPIAISYHTAVVTKGRVYVLGGQNASNVKLATVYTSIINADGTLGAWVASTALPEAMAYGECFVIRDKLYLHSGGTNKLFVAPINVDGTLGTWTRTTDLPYVPSGGQIIQTRNAIYYVLGIDNGAFSTKIIRANIAVDGTIGTWVECTATLPTAQSNSRAIVTSSKVYLVGGGTPTNSYSSIVQWFDFGGGRNDYSSFYDGSYVPVSSPDNFWLPDYLSKETFTEKYYIKY